MRLSIFSIINAIFFPDIRKYVSSHVLSRKGQKIVRPKKVVPRFLENLWASGDFCDLFSVAVSTCTALITATVCD